MKKFIAISLIVVCAVAAGAVWKVSTFEPSYSHELSVEVKQPDFSAIIESSSATSASLMVNGKIIGDKLGDEIRPIASTAKMILALAVMKAKPFQPNSNGAIITYSERDLANYNYQVAHGGSRTLVAVGANITERQMLEALLIRSSNNVADSLAMWAFGSIDAYRSYANKMLAEHDIHNVTIGNDASGLSPTTTASASNLAKIGDLVLADPVLSEIVKEARAVIPVHGEITSTNYLLGQDPTIVGIKTGTTEEAGSCFVLGAKDGQNTVVIAVMNVGTNGAIDESYNLYQQARTAAKNQLVVKKGAEIGVLKAGWLAEPVKMYANLDLSANIWDADDVSLSLDIPDNLINQSGEIGTLKLQTKTGQLSIPVYINQQFSGPNLLYKLLN